MEDQLHIANEPRAPSADAAPRLGGFEDFVQAEHASLYGALCLIVHDRAEAEDLAQDAFLRIWERWDRVREMESPAGYLFRVAMNLHRSRVRRASLTVRRALAPRPARDPMAEVETRDEVMRALATLTPGQRASVVLVDLLEYSSEEAAQILGVKSATVRVQASKARAALRRNTGETT
jgi:RNA polymerase sigma-70 factor (ECF subfamily)